ncbi:hypothetical protein AVEN_106182-1 [Araneus ventricosus]|uniref:Peptidase A2 domain-containing protein n=1 Tax=Araneus ventricosus TaxID=182803 RepID=A0A4Y2PJL2_ARAVE|nr:hypothetical protein AVEN_106182-1 [Araneus ventricosus]
MGQRLPDDKKPHFEVLQISSRSGSKNGPFTEAFVNEISCRMIVDTGANVTIIHQEFAQPLDGKILWTPPCVTLQTVIGDKILIAGKMNIKIRFGNVSYDHTIYVAEITDNFILGLDFLKKYNFIPDFKDNYLHSASEDATLFQSAGSEITPIVGQIKDPVPPQTDPWSDKDVREAQMKDPDIKPIIEFMESSNTRPIWQDISSFSPGTKRYWAIRNSLQI